MAAGAKVLESGGKKASVSEGDVYEAAARGAPWNIVCGLLQRWAGWKGEAKFGRKVGRVFESPGIMELGLAPWVGKRKMFEVDLEKPGGRRVLECVREMEMSGDDRIALPGMRVSGKGEDFEGLASNSLIREIRIDGRGDFRVFCSWLSGGGAPSLYTLNLYNNGIGVEDMHVFLEALSGGALSSLHTLNLWGNKIGDEGMQALSEALWGGVLPSLHTLNLGGNRIGSEGMRALSEAMSGGALSSLHALDLGGNEIGPEGMAALSEALSQGALSSLCTLNIRLCGIGSQGMVVLSEALSGGALSSLHTLILVDNRIAAASVTSTRENLSRIPKLYL